MWFGCWCDTHAIQCVYVFFLFKQRAAYEMRISDWSSDVCSSDLCWRWGHGCIGATLRYQFIKDTWPFRGLILRECRCCNGERKQARANKAQRHSVLPHLETVEGNRRMDRCIRPRRWKTGAGLRGTAPSREVWC